MAWQKMFMFHSHDQIQPEVGFTLEVRRAWNSRRHAIYRFADVQKLEWSRYAGGRGTKANGYYIHGYVMCDGMLSGKLDHSCKHGPAPHCIRVCLTMKDNKAIWPRVLEAVGEPKPIQKPGWRKKRSMKRKAKLLAALAAKNQVPQAAAR
jgi:hypothetical protein